MKEKWLKGSSNILFSGLGGIRLGLEQALAERGMRGKCVFTSEIKPSALKAHNLNFKNECIEATDITKVKIGDIEKFSILTMLEVVSEVVSEVQ